MQGVFLKKASIPVYVGGAELNVAIALATWGLPVKYITALPGNYFSEEILEDIAKKNIDTSGVRLCGERIGIYYLPQGADMKNQAVIYDRNHSSFASLKPGDINWDAVLTGVSWFHLSAISPALNESAAAVCLEAVRSASEKKIPISIDLNYRSKLWKYGKEPAVVIPGIAIYCDVIMGNIWAAEKLLGIPVSKDFTHTGATKETYLHEARETARQIRESFPRCTTVAQTFRFDEGEGIRYFATLHDGMDNYHSATHYSPHIIDKVGSGDCFMGGLIYGLYNKQSPHEIIEFAAAAAFAKLQEKGDATSNTVDNIKKIIAANG